MNDEPEPTGDPAEAPREKKPIGLKFILASAVLVVYVGYLVYVGFADPR